MSTYTQAQWASISTAAALARTMAAKSDDDLADIARLTGISHSAKMAAKRELNARNAARRLAREAR